MKFTQQYIKGFTLVELLVVIGIIGILAVAVIVAINPVAQTQKARDTRRKSDLKQIQTALELYNQDNSVYPDDATMATILSSTTAWGNYMASVPKDPGGKVYKYVRSGSGTGYRLYASLDRATDPQKCPSPGCTGAPANCGGTNICDYDVTSSNLTR